MFCLSNLIGLQKSCSGYKSGYTKNTRPSRLRGRVWLRQTNNYHGGSLITVIKSDLVPVTDSVLIYHNVINFYSKAPGSEVVYTLNIGFVATTHFEVDTLSTPEAVA